jgi:glycosyltransferase involved in cell wall biosynthesis
MHICINGRFLTQPITGVQRFAEEVVKALDLLIAGGEIRPPGKVSVLAPANVLRVPKFTAIEMSIRGQLKGHAWEQLELPWLAGGALIVNLCQVAPALRRRQLVVMHDASVYAVPWAFSRKFRAWYRVLMPLIARRSEKLATVSRFSRMELARYIKVAAERFAVIDESGDHILSAAPDRSVLTRHGLTARKFVLAVSSLNPNKNFAGLVQAFEFLSDGDFDIVVAGGSAPRVFGSALNLPASVKHIGYVSDGELRALYEAAACFVYPSFYEGFGLPPLEAMRCGCPVIASHAASMPEICAGGALYCDPHSPQDIADKISGLMGNTGLQDELRSKGLARAAEFSWERCARSLWDMLKPATET